MSKPPIFLAASVPERDLDKYAPEPVGIRDAIRALVAEVVRERLLVFGGHPAISPLVEHAARSLQAIDNVRIYQSEFFRASIPPVAQKFPNLTWTKADPQGREASLTAMRNEMISSQEFAAGIFVGGMQGLVEEWEIFARLHPSTPAFPIASTEGAARNLWNNWLPPSIPGMPADLNARLALKARLAQDLDYRILFRDILP
ncbi:MAG: hypothetical protein U0800_02885 [Isosphaeraceae bacterium]